MAKQPHFLTRLSPVQDALRGTRYPGSYAEYDQGQRSLRSLAQEFGIPESTIHSRASGTQTRREASEWQQALSQIQEDRLTQWVLTQAALGTPPNHGQIRLFGNRTLETQGTSKRRLGKRWVDQFIQRNPVLKTQRTRRIDSF